MKNKVYSDLKIFHFHSKLDDIVHQRFSPPIHVRIKPTNACNHSCYYCCYRSKKLPFAQLFNKTDFIPRDKMKKIITDLDRMKVQAVTFSGGGEPLLYPYIKESLKMLAQVGIGLGILTNGGLLRGEIADIVADTVSWVRISMDAADARTYSKYRNVSLKSFDLVCDNIKRFAKKKKSCKLGISFIVTEENHPQIFRYLEFMKRLGVDNVKISECVVSKDWRQGRKYMDKFFIPAREQIDKSLSRLADKNFMIIDRFHYPDEEDNNYSKSYAFCAFAQCLVIIGADLNVYACQDKAYAKSGKLFSIRDQGFSEGWFSPENRDSLRKLNPSRVCTHHCTQHAKNLMLSEYVAVNNAHLGFV